MYFAYSKPNNILKKGFQSRSFLIVVYSGMQRRCIVWQIIRLLMFNTSNFHVSQLGLSRYSIGQNFLIVSCLCHLLKPARSPHKTHNLQYWCYNCRQQMDHAMIKQLVYSVLLVPCQSKHDTVSIMATHLWLVMWWSHHNTLCCIIFLKVALVAQISINIESKSLNGSSGVIQVGTNLNEDQVRISSNTCIIWFLIILLLIIIPSSSQ